MAVLMLSIGLVAVFFIFMSVRLIFLKNGEFRGTCASQSPWLNKEGATCGYCGKTLTPADQACGNPEGEPEAFPEIKKKQ
jgi:predicted amidophosphoribosyltransferase